ncbi:MAG: putative 2OG-Fe(II) oxygenase [Caulobacteraceae bacterium]
MELLSAARPDQAAGVFRAALAEHPGLADAHRLLGLALRATGDGEGAERSLRAALKCDPTSGSAAYALSELLMERGRVEEALAAVAPLAVCADADMHILTAFGGALKALGRLEDARSAYVRAVAAAPASAVAEHNLAGVCGDLDAFAESEAAAKRAFAKGLDAPETWLVLARALLGLGRNAEAENAYRAVIARRPDHVDAHGELAQLIWMRTDDVEAAAVTLDLARMRFPQLQALVLKKAELLQTAGDFEGAYAAVEPVVARGDAEPMMHVIAARIALSRDPPRALKHALDAVAMIPENAVAQSTLCEARFATGDPVAAARIAARMHEADPTDQHALGLLATAWRLLGDARYEGLYDYNALVGTFHMETPECWPSPGAFLSDLSVALDRLHTFRTHPVGQSVRNGSQTSQRLTLSDDPAIRSFFSAMDAPIRRYIGALGPGNDPLRSRSTGGYTFNGEWSVRLREGGYHAGHLHPCGWLSSACYIVVPQAVDREREGWLKFGEPGVHTEPPLPAEYFVKPEPGLLALFPSYMWHGTVPFSGPDLRLTIAFDVAPA